MTDDKMREALQQLFDAFTDPEAGEVDRRLAIKDAREALTATQAQARTVADLVAATRSLLSLIRRNAPHLSGKVLGDAEGAISKAEAQPAPLFVFEHDDGRRITCRADDARLVGEPAWHRVGPADAPTDALPPEILSIIEHLHTQDNRITANPLFAVQQKRRVYGLDEDYAEHCEWVLDGEVWTAENEGDDPPDDARRLGYVDRWEFVTGCLTEQGCKDFIRINGHNLNEPRIYAYGSYRNAEFIALRKWLMGMRGRANEGAPTDAERLDFMVRECAWIVWTKRDGSIRQCQLWTQDSDELIHIASGESRFFNTAREAIDAAMRATPADGGEG